MKKNLSWPVILVLGVVGDLIGRFIQGGAITEGIGVLGDLLFVVGVIYMIIALVKRAKGGALVK